jgi:hypothetical protein
MRNKFIALWEPINGIFKIWNRITLKLEEVTVKMDYKQDACNGLIKKALKQLTCVFNRFIRDLHFNLIWIMNCMNMHYYIHRMGLFISGILPQKR